MTPEGTPAVRRAGPGDVVALASLARDTFVATFGHLYTPEDRTAFLEKSQTVAAYTPLLADPRIGVWVAEDSQGALVGFLTAGPCKLPVPALEPGAGEIRQLYLRSTAQGGGLGTRMLVTGLEWLAAQGHAPLYVGVWSGNFGAQRLYGRFGFEKIGEYDFPVGEHLDREFILRRRTPPPPAPAGS
ncbi:MAG: GNAT family N-acetyltransferase [Gammaproteobacteria bacterium]